MMLVNHSRTLEHMQSVDVDALVATSPANVAYLSGYSWWLDSLFRSYMIEAGTGGGRGSVSYAVFPASGEPALVVAAVLAPNARASSAVWVEDIRLVGGAPVDDLVFSQQRANERDEAEAQAVSTPNASTAGGALVDVLIDRGLSSARIGVEFEAAPAGLIAFLREELPRADFLDCTELMRLIRAAKSSEELRRMRSAVVTADSAAAAVMRRATPGAHIGDLTREFRKLLADEGADFDHFVVSVDGTGIASMPDRVLRRDELISIDYGCVLDLYYSDSGTSFSFAEPATEILNRWDAVKRAVAHAQACARPGVLCSEIHATLLESLKEDGVRHPMNPHGHGLGLEVRDYPIVGAASGMRIRDDLVDVSADLPMEKDMVINLEVAVLMPGIGCALHENTFLITAAGCEELRSDDVDSRRSGVSSTSRNDVPWTTQEAKEVVG